MSKYIGTATDIEYKKATCEIVKNRGGTYDEFSRELGKDEMNDSKLSFLEYETRMWGISQWQK